MKELDIILTMELNEVLAPNNLKGILYYESIECCCWGEYHSSMVETS